MTIKRLLLCISPLFLGGLLYVCFRTENLIMFSWFDYIGIDRQIDYIRQVSSDYGSYFDNWIKFSLPDALWLFSMLTMVILIWDFTIGPQSVIWIILVMSLGLISEIGQFFSLVPGTFDLIDLSLIFLAICLPFIIFKNKLKLNL